MHALPIGREVHTYLILGKGRHEDRDGAYAYAGEDVYRAPSTVRKHHKRLKHLLPYVKRLLRYVK